MGALTARAGAFFFKHRNLVFPLALIALFLLFPPRYFGGTRAADLWLDGVGILLLAAGQALRGAVIGFAYIKRGGMNKQVYADRLVTSGIFGLCRNPLYVGNFLILCGLLVVHNNPYAYVLGLGFFAFVYGSIVQVEEAYLRSHFGADYAQYCKDVPRWWLDLRRFPAATAGMAFDWRKVVAKDYGTALTWLLALAVMLPYEPWAMADQAAVPGRVVLGLVLILLVAPAALGIRWAKKSGRLVPRTA